MNVLLITNKVKTYNQAFKNDIEPILELGHSVIWAANFSEFIGNIEDIPIKTFNLPIQSNPLVLDNIKSYFKLKKIIQTEKIDFISCNTPIGGFLGRLLARKMKKKVLYAAHGLLFFKGAPFVNNTIYKLQEWIMARWTDVFVTINEEDYQAISRFKLKEGGKLYMIHGAGVSVKQPIVNKNLKRQEIGIPQNECVIISAGFLNKNKNNQVVIKAIGKYHLNVFYLICGDGNQKDRLLRLIHKYKIENKVKLLGFRTDVLELMTISDVFVIPSIREGVPRVLLEAMEIGLPCIGSNTRGIRELIGSDGGILCNPSSPKDFFNAITKLINDQSLCSRMVLNNKEEAKKYSTEIVREELKEIFQKSLCE